MLEHFRGIQHMSEKAGRPPKSGQLQVWDGLKLFYEYVLISTGGYNQYILSRDKFHSYKSGSSYLPENTGYGHKRLFNFIFYLDKIIWLYKPHWKYFIIDFNLNMVNYYYLALHTKYVMMIANFV